MPCCTPFGNFLNPAGKAGFAHGQSMEWDIGTAPGITCRRKIIGINLTFNLEYFDGNRFGNTSLIREPLSCSPT